MFYFFSFPFWSEDEGADIDEEDELEEMSDDEDEEEESEDDEEDEAKQARIKEKMKDAKEGTSQLFLHFSSLSVITTK